MKKEKLATWLIAAAYLILCALALFFFSRYAHSDRDKLYLSPIGSSAEGWDIYILEDGEKQPLSPEEYWGWDGTVYLERVIDPDWEAAGYTCLEFSAYRRQFSLFVDGSLFYTTTPGSGETPERAVFPAEYAGMSALGEPVRCTLPPGCGGKSLTVVTQAGAGIALTCEEVEKGITIALTNRLGMPAAAFGLAALSLLGLFLYALPRGKRDWPLLLLALAAAFQSLYWLREFDTRLTGSFPLNIPLAMFFPQLFILGPLAFLAAQMRRWRWPCAALAGLCGAAALSEPFLSGIGVIPWQLYSGALVAAIAATLFFAFLELRQGNRTFRAFFQAFGLLCAVFFLSCLLLPDLGDRCATSFRYALGGDFGLLLQLLGTGIFLVCAYVSAHQVIRRTADDQTAFELLKAREELIRDNLRIMQQSIAELSQVRHDARGNLSILQTLAQEGKYEKMEEYLSRLTRQTGEIVPLKLAAHPIVNAILLQSARRARDAGAEFRTQINLPEALPIPDEDLAALLMNLINNALDAVEEISKDRPRWVEITMHIRGNYLFIMGRNTYGQTPEPDAESGLFRSQKGAGHGYGMKIMESMARRYQSELQIESGNGIFTVRTALFMQSQA